MSTCNGAIDLILCLGFLVRNEKEMKIRMGKMKKKADSRPNILIFVPDEMRGEVITNPQIKMPNMRGLVDDGGIIFTQNFSVNPVCAPSRICTFTGQYPHNGAHRSLYQLLRPGEENLFHILKENGYEVMWIGRNDLFQKSAIHESVTKRIGGLVRDLIGPVIKEGIKKFGLFRMIRLGLKLRKMKDYKKMLSIPEIAHLAKIVMGKRPFSKESKWYNTFYAGKIPDEQARKSIDAKIIKNTLKYLEKVGKSKLKTRKPFCLYVPIAFPHPPYEVEDPYFSMYERSKLISPYPFTLEQTDRAKKPAYVNIMHQKYDLDKLSDDDYREILATYYGMCTKVDDLFGKLIQKLKELKMYDNTLVSIFADHGDYVCSYGLTEKWPTGMEDTLLNVPFLIKLPKERSSVTHSEVLTQTIDVFPTILEVAGIEHPYTHFGKSLLPLIRGSTKTHRDVVFAEGGYDQREPQAFEDISSSTEVPGVGIYYYKGKVQKDIPFTRCRATMIRTKKWKMTLRSSPEAVEELYDLENDPTELHNLFEEPKFTQIIAELKEQLLRWYLETSDNPHYEHKRDP